MRPVTGAEAPPDRPFALLASGGEGEVSALSVGTYHVATMVFEITRPPRPASPVSTSEVETVHPLCSCCVALDDAPWRLHRIPDTAPPALHPDRVAPVREMSRRLRQDWVLGMYESLG